MQQEALRAMVQRPDFKHILREWAHHVKFGESPFVFTNMYLEWMMDPLDPEIRTACSVFISFTRTRPWDELLQVIGPALDKGVLEIFRRRYAADFYEDFKAMVLEQIRAYWQEFMTARGKPKLPGPKDWSPIGEYKLKRQ